MNRQTPPPNTAIDASSAESSAQRKARLESEITSLQNANRLGIHIWEDQILYEFPEHSRQQFAQADAKGTKTLIQDALDGKDVNFISLSLIPPQSRKYNMRPYDTMSQRPPTPGYLVDLSDAPDDPARVLRAYELGLSSDDAAFAGKKNFRIDYPSHMKELNNLYQAYDRQEDWIANALTQDDDHSLSALQLDAISDAYDKVISAHTEYNEVIAAAKTDHIKAIVVPVTHSCRTEDNHLRRALCECLGALAGLQHLEKGLDLPVFTYDIVEVVRDHNVGSCHYLAQGRDELLSVVKQSLALLSDERDFLKREAFVISGDNYGKAPIALLNKYCKDVIGDEAYIDIIQGRASHER